MNNTAAEPYQWIPLENGEIKSSHISFNATPVPKMTFKYEGKIDGDEIEMTSRMKMPRRPGMSRSGGGGDPIQGRRVLATVAAPV
jgi:hypothetical protein